MKKYIAIGGIGCQILSQLYAHHAVRREDCYYIDLSASDLQAHTGADAQRYCIPFHLHCSNTYRHLGRNAAKYAILTHRMEPLFRGIIDADSIEPVFIISSFGGTGSGAVFDIAEYVQALLWSPDHSRCSGCTIIAFGPDSIPFAAQMPAMRRRLFDMNTIQMVTEAIACEQKQSDCADLTRQDIRVFQPAVRCILINEPLCPFAQLYQLLLKNDEDLEALDCKHAYLIKSRFSSPPVFISYSSKDQAVADLFADALEQAGIGYWMFSKSAKTGSYAKQIMQAVNGAKVFLLLLSPSSIASQHVKNELDRAHARIKDGIRLLPVLIDTCKLDEECEYYLCRQEIFDGTTPPMADKIQHLISMIQADLE